MAEVGAGASKGPLSRDPVSAAAAPATPIPGAVPSRNPLPLSNSQEAQVREIYHRRVRVICDPEIKAFAQCTAGRSFSISWACKAQQRAMNLCMKINATTAEQDAAREEWFATRLAHQRERELKARKARQQEDFIREWWGLPEADREKRAREAEKMRQAERVHGQAAKREEKGEQERS